jgi:hypothetical protein
MWRGNVICSEVNKLSTKDSKCGGELRNGPRKPIFFIFGVNEKQVVLMLMSRAFTLKETAHVVPNGKKTPNKPSTMATGKLLPTVSVQPQTLAMSKPYLINHFQMC